MINGEKVLAVIPARSGSKGIPGKNIKMMAGKPLITWPIIAAKGSKFIDKIIVSTDSQDIADIAISYGAEIPFLRPDELAQDTSTTFSVIEHLVNYLFQQGEQYEYLVLLEPTSPLTTSSDIDNALKKLVNSREVADSIVGVSKVEATHPVFCVSIGDDGLISPYIGGFTKPIRRQEINDLYFKEGSLYISDTIVLLDKMSFYHERTLPFIVPKWKSLEVDDIVDFVCIQAIIKNMNLLKKGNYG